MPDCISLFRYRNSSGIVSFFQSGTGLPWCRIIRHSGSQNFKRLSFLKGQCHESFNLWFFFSSNNTPWDPDSRTKDFFNSASNSPGYHRFSNAKIVYRKHENFLLGGSPFKFTYFCIGGKVQFAKIYFLIDILGARFYLTLYQVNLFKSNESIWTSFPVAC
jgi:hypothetical protein